MPRVPTVSVLPTRWWAAFGDGESSYAAMPPKLQHRIRGALNAAGFESAGRKFSSGDYKGVTVFARIQREPDYPPALAKRGERYGEASLILALHRSTLVSRRKLSAHCGLTALP